MDASQIYIAISAIVLIVIAVLFVLKRKDRNQKKLSPLAAFAFILVITGIVFGDDRIIGYSLIGIGLVLAIIDIVRIRKKKEQDSNPSQ
ncbi:MAG: hypothetical protein COT24_00490 [Candidatus Kerfeldbacteria bacterium CG08_land_8_20_14_0_20_40_16]|uniref:Uncharacterized protein n=1 Tax=Candidatus Kerfeldbacteria bacterium CG08_land_8_20_14_0_20_40_16 TaxID=2014244 RepID=A0A2H0YZ43_9BACT|nr:MAG: hypothetical protein COT24_00490 [Candidatus Kerfeldbacteria bacterium CG08_land_8_20_14_0_20_40_16]